MTWYGTGASFLRTSFEVVQLGKVPLLVKTVGTLLWKYQYGTSFRPNLVTSQVGKKSILKTKVGPGRLKCICTIANTANAYVLSM